MKKNTVPSGWKVVRLDLVKYLLEARGRISGSLRTRKLVGGGIVERVKSAFSKRFQVESQGEIVGIGEATPR